VHSKKIGRGFYVFRNPLFPIPDQSSSPSCPGARKPMSVATLLNLPRRKGATMQKANACPCKAKMDKIVRRRELPYVRLLRSLYRGRVVRGKVTCLWKEKSVE
jgi:hypothetical protein